MTFSAVGESGTLQLDGSTLAISKATSHCTWVIKSTCGAPGFLFDSTLTDSDFKISVVEYTEEFTLGATPATVLEGAGNVFWPKEKNPTENNEQLFYSDAVSVAGELASFQETLGTSSYIRHTPGKTIIDWLTWTTAVYA